MPGHKEAVCAGLIERLHKIANRCIRDGSLLFLTRLD